MPATTALAWLRLDLRLKDNPVLHEARRVAQRVVPVFIWAPHEEEPWAPGAASRWWLHRSLESFQADLRGIGSRLILRKGDSAAELAALAKETQATHLIFSRRYEPAAAARDDAVAQRLGRCGMAVTRTAGNLLLEPEAVLTGSATPYKVFTPFWNRMRSMAPFSEPLPGIAKLPGPPRWPGTLSIADLDLLPRVHWYEEMEEQWLPGERGALRRLKAFADSQAVRYESSRDRMDLDATSKLSPHLHFGEISIRAVWQAMEENGASEAFRRQLAWREFAHGLLVHFPHTHDQPLREEFASFPWAWDGAKLKAWQRGRTGVAVVDAAMRQLWRTGWMHNRARLITASFLVKDLRLHWLQGARWFWDTLVDADLANNTLGWQWMAGCGADAAPYFRILNPERQARRFDPEDAYVHRWLGDAARPQPMIRHAAARQAALQAYASWRKSR